jgi:hypothetical protein
MKTKFLLAVVASVAALGVVRAASTPEKPSRVTVTFDHPDKFTDVKDSELATEKGRDGYLDDLKEYIQRYAEPRLADGQKLTVTFTDIDMAGDFEPWRGPRFNDIRIVKDIYPPRLTFSFQLTDASGAVVKEGKRDLRDLSFQLRANPVNQDDPLRYEKSMLDDWMRDEFPKAKKSK